MHAGLTLEDMDYLFMQSTHKLVWQSVVQRKKISDLFQSNARVSHRLDLGGKGADLEQIEAVEERRDTA